MPHQTFLYDRGERKYSNIISSCSKQTKGAHLQNSYKQIIFVKSSKKKKPNKLKKKNEIKK